MYFIALVAPEEINQKVLKWKHWMKEKYNCEAALRSPAHITLIPPFWMKPELQDELHASISACAATRDPFTVQLKGFSNFKPKVIFIDVILSAGLVKTKTDLVDYLLTEKKYPVETDDRPFHPHVTIATRDLHKKSFYEAWDHFKEKKYEAEWIAEGISLLRHNKKNWDVIATSQFR